MCNRLIDFLKKKIIFYVTISNLALGQNIQLIMQSSVLLAKSKERNDGRGFCYGIF